MVGKIMGNGDEEVALAGKAHSTVLNTARNSNKSSLESVSQNWAWYKSDWKAIRGILLESYPKPPRAIVLDLDVTDDQVHGSQEQSFFNTYYDVCYAPLYIFFVWQHLLCAKLRPAMLTQQRSNRWVATSDSADTFSLEFVNILVRGDSAYSREEIMRLVRISSWGWLCVRVKPEFAVDKNDASTQQKARDCYDKTKQTVVSFLKSYFTTRRLEQRNRNLLKPSVLYRSLSYQTLESWSRFRRVVSKVEFAEWRKRSFCCHLPCNYQSTSRWLLYPKVLSPGEMSNRFGATAWII